MGLGRAAVNNLTTYDLKANLRFCRHHGVRAPHSPVLFAPGRLLFLGESIMFGLGFGELLLILVIILIVFGVGRLPELGGALGEGIKNFKKGYRESKTLDVTPDDKPKS